MMVLMSYEIGAKIMKNPTRTWYGEYPNIALTMTLEQAKSVHHPGNCDQEVADLASVLNTSAIDPENLKEELDEYGAWDSEQLQDHEENILRWIWICAGNIVKDEEEPRS